TFTSPLISIAIVGLLLVVPLIDPLKENIKKFKDYYYEFIVFFLVFMLLVQLQTLLWNVGVKIQINLFIPILMGVLFYLIGVLLEKAKRNWFIGIRTPWTLSSDTVWDKTHKKGALLFKVCGVIALIGALFGSYSMYFILVPILVSTLFLLIYSYLEYQKEQKSAN
ncbi:MAG: SdpI family protein, partial [Caldisericaceae bacterium]